MNFFSLFKRKIIYNLKKKISIDNDKYDTQSLDSLFYYYGSDKANIFKKKNVKGHGYSIFYENELKNFKNRKINILEIGSYAGSSAAAFAKYFPESKIFCFDINISKFEYRSNQIHVFGIDINNEKEVKKTLKKIFKLYNFENFNLIIDDGSHNLSDILVSLKIFFKYLKSSGILIIEDFKHPNYYNYNKNIDHIFVNKVLDNLQNKKFFPSQIISKNEQINLINSIEKIQIYKGNLTDSDISFIKKK